jgi:hypothetical protein
MLQRAGNRGKMDRESGGRSRRGNTRITKNRPGRSRKRIELTVRSLSVLLHPPRMSHKRSGAHERHHDAYAKSVTPRPLSLNPLETPRLEWSTPHRKHTPTSRGCGVQVLAPQTTYCKAWGADSYPLPPPLNPAIQESSQRRKTPSSFPLHPPRVTPNRDNIRQHHRNAYATGERPMPSPSRELETYVSSAPCLAEHTTTPPSLHRSISLNPRHPYREPRVKLRASHLLT